MGEGETQRAAPASSASRRPLLHDGPANTPSPRGLPTHGGPSTKNGRRPASCRNAARNGCAPLHQGRVARSLPPWAGRSTKKPPVCVGATPGTKTPAGQEANAGCDLPGLQPVPRRRTVTGGRAGDRLPGARQRRRRGPPDLAEPPHGLTIPHPAGSPRRPHRLRPRHTLPPRARTGCWPARRDSWPR